MNDCDHVRRLRNTSTTAPRSAQKPARFGVHIGALCALTILAGCGTTRTITVTKTETTTVTTTTPARTVTAPSSPAPDPATVPTASDQSAPIPVLGADTTCTDWLSAPGYPKLQLLLRAGWPARIADTATSLYDQGCANTTQGGDPAGVLVLSPIFSGVVLRLGTGSLSQADIDAMGKRLHAA